MGAAPSCDGVDPPVLEALARERAAQQGLANHSAPVLSEAGIEALVSSHRASSGALAAAAASSGRRERAAGPDRRQVLSGQPSAQGGDGGSARFPVGKAASSDSSSGRLGAPLRTRGAGSDPETPPGPGMQPGSGSSNAEASAAPAEVMLDERRIAELEKELLMAAEELQRCRSSMKELSGTQVVQSLLYQLTLKDNEVQWLRDALGAAIRKDEPEQSQRRGQTTPAISPPAQTTPAIEEKLRDMQDISKKIQEAVPADRLQAAIRTSVEDETKTVVLTCENQKLSVRQTSVASQATSIGAWGEKWSPHLLGAAVSEQQSCASSPMSIKDLEQQSSSVLAESTAALKTELTELMNRVTRGEDPNEQTAEERRNLLLQLKNEIRGRYREACQNSAAPRRQALSPRQTAEATQALASPRGSSGTCGQDMRPQQQSRQQRQPRQVQTPHSPPQRSRRSPKGSHFPRATSYSEDMATPYHEGVGGSGALWSGRREEESCRKERQSDRHDRASSERPRRSKGVRGSSPTRNEPNDGFVDKVGFKPDQASPSTRSKADAMKSAVADAAAWPSPVRSPRRARQSETSPRSTKDLASGRSPEHDMSHGNGSYTGYPQMANSPGIAATPRAKVHGANGDRRSATAQSPTQTPTATAAGKQGTPVPTLRSKFMQRRDEMKRRRGDRSLSPQASEFSSDALRAELIGSARMPTGPAGRAKGRSLALPPGTSGQTSWSPTVTADTGSAGSTTADAHTAATDAALPKSASVGSFKAHTYAPLVDDGLPTGRSDVLSTTSGPPPPARSPRHSEGNRLPASRITEGPPQFTSPVRTVPGSHSVMPSPSLQQRAAMLSPVRSIGQDQNHVPMRHSMASAHSPRSTGLAGSVNFPIGGSTQQMSMDGTTVSYQRVVGGAAGPPVGPPRSSLPTSPGSGVQSPSIGWRVHHR